MGSGRKVRSVTVKMLPSGWIFKNSSGEDTSYQDLADVLSRTPDSLLHTDLMKTLVESFYEKQKKYILRHGFIPYTLYLAAAIVYYCGEMKDDDFQNDPDRNYNQSGTVAYAITVAGTLYFALVEVRQAYRLKLVAYINGFNFTDIFIIGANTYLLID